MQLLFCDRLAKSFGSRTLFNGLTLRVESGDKIGLIGANGVGKTTLFRLLAGEEPPDEGRVVKAAGLRLATMRQHVPEAADQTMREFMLAAFAPLVALERELEETRRALEASPGEELLARQQALLEHWGREDGPTFRSRCEAALTGLGFTEQQKALPLCSLSGGQRSKLALARLLVAPADLLLLDEPTNHLDLAATAWLEETLRTAKPAFVVVSHDRAFLDAVTNRTAELSHGGLTAAKGNYTAYAALKAQRQAAEEKHYQKQRQEIERLEASAAQLRQWNREKSVKRAENKQKEIDRRTEQLQKPVAEGRAPRFAFIPALPGPGEVLRAEGISIAFGDGAPLYSGVSLLLRRGERVFLTGPNGCGKTTLLRQLLGQLKGEGSVYFGPGVSVGYYDQTGRDLNPAKTVLQEVWDTYPKLPLTRVRGALAAFLFTGDAVDRPVGLCSGGERARLALCKTMLAGHNLLLLDEPTNHLDIPSREALEAALAGYTGTLLMVSHDRYFIHKLATRVLRLTPAGLTAPPAEEPAPAAINEPPAEKPAMGQGGADYHKRLAHSRELRRVKSEVARWEATLNELEAAITELKARINGEEAAADYARLLELTRALEEREREANDATERWAEAAERLEALQQEE